MFTIEQYEELDWLKEQCQAAILDDPEDEIATELLERVEIVLTKKEYTW